MNNTLHYKNYIGSIEYSEEDNILYGKLQGIRALVEYEGNTIQELVEDFHTAVDDYLAVCDANNEEPEKSFKGSFNIRCGPELHRNLAICAMRQNVSLNSLVEEALREYLLKYKDLYEIA